MREVVRMEEVFSKFVNSLNVEQINAAIEQIGESNGRVTECLLNTLVKRKMTLAQVI